MSNTKHTEGKRLATCKGCGIEYNRDNVARVYGSESSVSLGNYHSAECYTESRRNNATEIDKEKGLVEICGSIVPLSEVERVWNLHCTAKPEELHTEEAFTKGPWVAKFRPGIAANECSFYGLKDKYIGMFSFSVGHHSDINKWREIGKANANLIGAAADMYFALKSVLPYLKAEGTNGNHWAEMVEKALAKANPKLTNHER
jgi:hypothetical protein